MSHSAMGVSNDLIVRVTRGAQARSVARAHGLTILDHIEGSSLYRMSLPARLDVSTTMRHLSADPRVVYAEPDRLAVSRDTAFTQQFHIAFVDGSDSSGYIDQMAYSQIDFVPGQTGGPGPGVGQGTIVAILDTGATFTHPALQGHYLPGFNLIDPGTPPLDIADGQTNSAVGHGTMVAGIVAMVDPSAQILPIRVLNGDGVGSLFDVIHGIHRAVRHGAQVINLSLSVDQSTHALRDAVCDAEEAGVAVIAAVGNDGTAGPHYPASYPGVIGVASVEADDTLSPFSNFGASANLDAPGDGITSTYYTGGYATWSGTSFSAPFVTGELALVLENSPWLDLNDLTLTVELSANPIDDLNPDFAGQLGSGIIDVGVAVGN